MMKINKDTILRYLDNDLSDNEKRDFENKLKSDKEFNLEYQNIISILKSLKQEVEVDERYFNALIPKAQEKAEKSKRSSIKITRFAYFLPVIIIGVIILFSYTSDNNFNTNYSFKEFVEGVMEDEEIVMDIIEESLETNNLYLYDSDIKYMEELYSDNYEIDESYFNYAEENIYPSDIDRTFLNNLTESEFDNIYSKLLSKKIIGE